MYKYVAVYMYATVCHGMRCQVKRWARIVLLGDTGYLGCYKLQQQTEREACFSPHTSNASNRPRHRIIRNKLWGM